MLGRVRDDVRTATGGRQLPFNYGTLGGDELVLAAVPGAGVPQPQRTPAPPVSATPKQPADTRIAWGRIETTIDTTAIRAWQQQFGASNPFYNQQATARLAMLDEIARKEAAQRAAARRLAELSRDAGWIFRDCTDCPEMVIVRSGSFSMGSPANEEGRHSSEGPQRTVTIAQPFAVGKFEVMFAEWDACVAGGGCQGNRSPTDQGWGKGRRPVITVSWDDANQYVAWLSRKTGKTYRLLTEAEWEYAARAGGTGRWTFGDDERRLGEFGWLSANAGGKTQAVGGKTVNAFGLHDMHGNVMEWVEDCWNDNYIGAPSDSSAWTTGCTDGTRRVVRGGSWFVINRNLRSADRHRYSTVFRNSGVGFRVARVVP